ncbi:MAG: LEPR-XLL domain-containing protein [Proteobacteria bacterium]|nr:LEPR-XLL domain-containing protein [Pseudomonadota bacterium]
MKKGSRPSKIRLVFEQLEPRVLFSADPLFAPVASHMPQGHA